MRRRADGCCEYCRHRDDYSSDPFEVEHVLPLDAGGTDHPDNLAYACRGCNGLKSALTEATDPATGQTAALFHPRRDLWSEHFAWTEDFTEVRGLTAAGRATVEALALNREGLRNLRTALHPLGVHPPAEDVPTNTAIL
ncbi:MAG TPA: HNH endonuclease signature motif containing protein [Armatimonadaceae bacterium]|nr:HNH endonuclease signature motif containing protein [Armatimonadaceae bacterium]